MSVLAELRAGDAERVGLGRLATYAAPVVGLSSPLFLVQFFFLKYATDVLLMAPAVVALIFGLGRAWDAVTDPLVGAWSDGTRSRIGRRRPWMLAGIPLLLACYAMVWLPPAELATWQLRLWVAVGLFGFFTGFTAYIVIGVTLEERTLIELHGVSYVEYRRNVRALVPFPGRR